ncbi:MAG TPA: LuxR C-terminal-related transcriptional regulator [Kineosporiaceae bacterium]|nr:LuxR C-terminal-related transcriptional regulator [Kineosporiaceae bacterium]
MASRIAGASGNLPFELTTFVGRGDEVRLAREELTRSRLVTLTGIGGVGKTRLALRVARASAQAFQDGVWLVELDQVHDEGLLAQTIADALGIGEVPGAPTTLVDHLAEREILVVLDNCEHLVEPVATLAETLLRGCARLRILVTSRESLRVVGEVVLAVPSLSTPAAGQAVSLRKLSGYEAVALFVDRARAAVPTFELTEANAASVTEICSRLDGLPLAIELAAARLRVLTPAQISARLRNRFALLTSSSRGRPTRQQTLRACIEWSFELCSREEQRLWGRLSVFAGGFELDAVQSVCSGDDLGEQDVLDLLGALVDKSILTRDQTGAVVRFRMLETLCHYGAERLRDSGEQPKLRRRHRDWYEQLVMRARADWIGPRQAHWLQRLDRERPDIRASLEFSLREPGESVSALRISAELHVYWIIRGLTSEARHWLGRALAQRPSGISSERLEAAYTATVLAAVQGDITAAIPLAQHAEEVAARLGDPRSHAIASLATGAVALQGGDPAQAVTVLQSALEVFESAGDLYWTAITLAGLARVKGFLGDSQAAARYYAALRSHSPSCVWLQSEALGALGLGLWKDGDTEQALQRLTASLQLKQGMTDTFGTVLCLDTLAWIAADQGRFRRAAILLGAVGALARPLASPPTPDPGLLAHHEQCAQQAIMALGDSAFRAALARGEDLSLNEAIAYALDNDLDEPLPTIQVTTAAGPAASTLTARQWQICELIAEGLDTKDIAAKLFLSQRTVEGHIQNILNKLDINNRAGIVTWTLQERADPPGHGPDAGRWPRPE